MQRIVRPILFTCLFALAAASCQPGGSAAPVSSTAAASSTDVPPATPVRESTPPEPPSASTPRPTATIGYAEPDPTPTALPGDAWFLPQLTTCEMDGCVYQAFQPFQYPIPGEYAPYVEKTYRYGSTQSGTRESHSGVEIPAELGTPVLAAADAVVYYAGDDLTTRYGRYKDFYGNLIILEHHFAGLDQPVYTLYAHLSDIIVQTGDEVLAGQQIGSVGNSGATSGVHLHFEVRRGTPLVTSTVNPELWLVPREFQPKDAKDAPLITGTLVVRLLNGTSAVSSKPVKLEMYDEVQNSRIAALDAESYAAGVPQDADWYENLVIGSLQPGTYRVTVVIDNRMYEKWVKIESEQITLVEFDFAE